MALISTPGGSTSNSLTSVAFADAYLLTECVGFGAWDSYGSGQKEAALIEVTAELEEQQYKGRRVTTTQALSFPRSGIFNKSGVQYSTTVVPDNVQKACARLAFEKLEADSGGVNAVADGLDLSAFKSVKIGDFAAELREGKSGEGFSSSVKLLLRDFILTSQARVVRG